eukprot:TRINITY_DN7753_c0_g1_i2.p1 TRINITY_DN7753_c0_g1~~TRINITY_DN7753_c0_g1_i2.p1  ORF type:complete len:214 (+),score=51.79 TRINITY_DN7753_c0_g1_i2:35-643(+)
MCDCKDHVHGSDAGDRGPEFSLFQHIAIDQVRALNERVVGSVRNVFRPWEDRLDRTRFMDSNEDDPELLVHIPFTGVVKLKSIVVIGGEDGTAPSKMRVFTNRDDIDFSTVNDVVPVQAWDIHEDTRGAIEYTTRAAKFINVSSLSIHFPSNFGADSSRIYYIGLKGDFQPLKREAVMAVYESKPQPADHKTSSAEMSRSIQ